jgi:hypothetical protein
VWKGKTTDGVSYSWSTISSGGTLHWFAPESLPEALTSTAPAIAAGNGNSESEQYEYTGLVAYKGRTNANVYYETLSIGEADAARANME